MEQARPETWKRCSMCLYCRTHRHQVILETPKVDSCACSTLGRFNHVSLGRLKERVHRPSKHSIAALQPVQRIEQQDRHSERSKTHKTNWFDLQHPSLIVRPQVHKRRCKENPWEEKEDQKVLKHGLQGRAVVPPFSQIEVRESRSNHEVKAQHEC